MAVVNLLQQAYPQGKVLYPTYNTSGVVVLALTDQTLALIAEQMVTNRIALTGPPLPEINSMRADAIASIVPPGALGE